MSDPKTISPMLDGFTVGKAISAHNGVRCCPAMKEDSENKYILKVISIPASQTQLDALLLTGAYKDPAAALDYFKALSDDIVAEAEVLQKLSKLEGFLPYEKWQVETMANNNLGYEVYLLSTYKRSLDKYMKQNPMTHLAAVNLGLDLCAALAICRKAGYLYVDLKPANIFVSEEKEYRIGDLGFIKLDSMKYASLPSMYRSEYTAPEMNDPMSTLNNTVDIYALGLILYQVYNNGVLPVQENTEENPLPTPLNADYEIAEIIMKACAPDPRDRWDDPMAMGQALASYLQRNTVNDVPIGPPMATIEEPEEIPAPENPAEEVAEEPPHEELAFLQDMVTDETAPDEADAQDVVEQDISNEVNSMLNQAEDLITHEIPDASITTETINIPDIQAISSENKPADEDTAALAAPEEPAAEDKRETTVVDTTAIRKAQPGFHIFDDVDNYDEYDDEDEDENEEETVVETPEKPKKKVSVLVLLLIGLLLTGLLIGGFFFYRNYYLLNIDVLDVDGSNNQVTVTVDTDIDPTLLTVICSDTYGNTKRTTLSDGKAVFTGLTPDTLYKIQLEVDGFHKLTGPTYSSYITAAETKITSFTGVTGSEDGSVVLTFTVEGPEKTPDWAVSYVTEGEEAKTQTFSGHSVNITGLTVGKVYTFTLIPATELYMVGESTLEFKASPIILAQDLKILSCAEGRLTAQWSAPADTAVENWFVRCYSEDGIELSETTTETSVTFLEIQQGKAYTVEVTAAGMTQTARTSVTANPITVTGITVDDSTAEVLNVSWEFQGSAPEGGWHLVYTIDQNTEQKVVRCESNNGQIDLRIPSATYHITIQAADGTTIFCEPFTYQCPDAEIFNQHALPRSKISTNLLVTPTKADWSYKDVKKNQFTTTFKADQSMSVLLQATVDFYLPREDTTILCIIRDSEGNVLSESIYRDTDTWYNMWNNKNYHYFELDLPATPKTPGDYTMELYFNGCIATSKSFAITE